MDIVPRFELENVIDTELVVSFDQNKCIDTVLIKDISMLKFIIKYLGHNIKLLSKLLLLCKDPLYIFYLLLMDSRDPISESRIDECIITIYIKTCINHLYDMPTFSKTTKVKHILQLEFQDEINALCHYMDQALRIKGVEHPHIKAVTSCIVLRGICPRLVVYSLETSKDLMKIAGVSSLSLHDVPSDKEIEKESFNVKKKDKPCLKRMERVHMCSECKNWVCAPCQDKEDKLKNDSPRGKFKTLSRLRLNLTDISDSNLTSRFSISPRTPKTPTTPKIAEYNRQMALKYDRFCRDIVIKGHKYITMPYTPKERDILFTIDDIGTLKDIWHTMIKEEFHNKEWIISYGLALQTIINNKSQNKDLYYWNMLFTEDELKILLNNHNKTVTEIKKLILNDKTHRYSTKSLDKYISGWISEYNRILN